MSDRPIRDNSGSFSRNLRKEKETHPDFKGQATIGGVAFWISGWMKENDRGKWMSLSFEPKDASVQAPTQHSQPAQSSYQPKSLTPGTYPQASGRQGGPKMSAADLDDDIPF